MTVSMPSIEVGTVGTAMSHSQEVCHMSSSLFMHTCPRSYVSVLACTHLFCSYTFTFSHTHFGRLFSLVRVYFHLFTFVLTFAGSTLITRAHFHQYTACARLHPPALIYDHLCSFMPACTRLHLPAFICANLQSFRSLFSTVRTRFQWNTFIFDGSHLTLTLFSQ